MIRNERKTVVLDTNVIYPVVVRDILFWFAHYDLFIPKWTEHIFNEWRNVLITKGVDEPKANSIIARANFAFPEATVYGYNELIESLTLPDLKDRHVMAAAIKSKATLIVTNNRKDFPESYLNTFQIKTTTADDFLADIIIRNPGLALAAFLEMIEHKRNPPISPLEMLSIYRKLGLSHTSAQFQLLL